jgi:ADP-ribose pyrophosphatase
MTSYRNPRRSIYHGRLIDLGVETAHLPNGHTVELEIVRHPGGAVAVAINEDVQVCLLKQFRYAVDQPALWELPAGCIDEADETPLATAGRELREEAGVVAEIWHELGSILPSPGFCDERLHLFLAQNLTQVETRQDTDEIIEIHWIALDEAMTMAAEGQIIDAKTVVGLFRAYHKLSGAPDYKLRF